MWSHGRIAPGMLAFVYNRIFRGLSSPGGLDRGGFSFTSSATTVNTVSWGCSAFTDGWFLGLMVSDVSSLSHPPARRPRLPLTSTTNERGLMPIGDLCGDGGHWHRVERKDRIIPEGGRQETR